MRKITLMLTLLSFSLLTFAQMPRIEKVKSNADFHVNNYKSAKSIKTAGDVFWEEHFDSTRWATSVNDENLAIPANMPDGWTVLDVTNNKFFWHWSQQGPRGAYTSHLDNTLDPDPNYLLRSTTSANGVMMLESDFFNTDANGEIVSEPIDMESYIQTPAIDLSGTPGVTLRFQQFYRYCCSYSDKLMVWVSADYDPASPDDAHWAEYNTMSATVNDYTTNPDIVEVDISDIATDQDSVYIRWGQVGSSHYMWQIDDVELVEPMSNNILIEQVWADYLLAPPTGADVDPTDDWYGGYIDIPLDVVGDYVAFRAAVKNFGLATQTGVQLNTVITKDDETEVYNNVSDKVDIEKSLRDTLTTVGFTPTSKGHYQVSYTVSQEQDDEYMANNYDAIYFNVTDSIFSRTSDDPGNYQSVSSGGWVGGGNDGDALANLYEIPESAGQVQVSSITTYYHTRNDSALIADGNMSMIARLYGLDAEGNVSETPIISSEMYYITFADTGNFITLPFIKDGSEFIQSGDYYAAIETYSTDADKHFYIAEDKTVPYPSGNCIVYLGDHWGTVGANFVIDLNIVPTTPQDVTFNVNMSRQITKENFDPATDKINIAGTMNSWGSTEMTDADGDSIYTYVLEQQIIGSTIEYKYRINEDWETVDANRTHTVSANGAENILIAWYSDDDGVGIEDLNNLNEISIYPNPVSDNLHIDNINNINRIVISNVLGQEVRTINNPVNNVTINASDFNKGMYIVTIIDNNNNSKSIRFIKK